MLKYSPFVTGKIQTVTHCWKRCLVHLAGVRQLMFYQLGVNDIHTISASACVLTRFPVYHPGNVVWFGVVEGILLIQVPANLTKGSPIINVCVNKGDGARRKAGKGDCRSWWEVFPLLPLLCGTFPWRRKRWRQTSPEPRLLLPRVLRWAVVIPLRGCPYSWEIPAVSDHTQKCLGMRIKPVRSIPAFFIAQAKLPSTLVGQLQNAHMIL